MSKAEAIVGLALVLGGVIACSSEMPIGESTRKDKGPLGAVGQAPKADGSCDPLLVACGGTCRDLRSDEANCGSCGRACEESLTCSSGVCSSAPPPPPPSFTPPPSSTVDGGPDGGECDSREIRCGADCVDVLFDDANCGACGTVCPQDTRCSLGVCMKMSIAKH